MNFSVALKQAFWSFMSIIPSKYWCVASKLFTDIDGKAIEVLIKRASEAKENNLVLNLQDDRHYYLDIAR